MAAGPLVRVETPDDPRVAPYVALKDRDLAARDGLFIVEGSIALERLIRHARFPLVSLLLAEGRLPALAPLLEELGDRAPVFVAARPVMDRLVGLPLHRGVLALARRCPEMSHANLLAATPPPEGALVAGLIGLSNADNVGACFRNAAAFGADAMLLDAACCDPLYRKAIRVSSGACLTLPYARYGAPSEMTAALEADGFDIWSLSPSGGEPLALLEPPPRLALLLGAEGPGLPYEVLAKTRRVTIPMAAGETAMDSLNVATAGAIALAHVFARTRQSL